MHFQYEDKHVTRYILLYTFRILQQGLSEVTISLLWFAEYNAK